MINLFPCQPSTDVARQSTGRAPMTPEEWRRCLQLLRWPQWRVAEELGIPGLKARKWACGAEAIPEVVAIWMRAISERIDAVYAQLPPPSVPRQMRAPKPVAVAAE